MPNFRPQKKWDPQGPRWVQEKKVLRLKVDDKGARDGRDADDGDASRSSTNMGLERLRGGRHREKGAYPLYFSRVGSSLTATKGEVFLPERGWPFLKELVSKGKS